MTTGTRLSVVFADVYEDLELAYQGKNKYGGDVAEIYAYRLVEGRRRHPTTISIEIRDWTEADSQKAAENLAAVMREFCIEHPGTRFALETGFRQFEHPVVLDLEHPIPAFNHRIHVQVIRPAYDAVRPKICLGVTLRWENAEDARAPTMFRIVVDPYETPDYRIEERGTDLVGKPCWKPLSRRTDRLVNELAARAMFALSTRKDWPTRTEGGVLYIDLGTQTWHEEV